MSSQPPKLVQPPRERDGGVEPRELSRWLNSIWLMLSGAQGLSWAVISKVGSKLSDIEDRKHSMLTEVGTNTHVQIDTALTRLADTRGTNTGDETAATVGALIDGAAAKAAPVDADQLGLMDSAAGSVLKKLSWANIKAALSSLYLLLAGKAGGQAVSGGTAAGETLTLSSTAHATKGKLLIGTSAYDEAHNRLGLGTTSPLAQLHIKSSVPSFILESVDYSDTQMQFVNGPGTTFRLGPNEDGDFVLVLNDSVSDTYLFSINLSGLAFYGHLGCAGISSTGFMTVLQADNPPDASTGSLALKDGRSWAADSGPSISFAGGVGPGAASYFAMIKAAKATSVSGNKDAYLSFLVGSQASGGVVAEKMRLNAAGWLGIGATAPQSPLHVVGLPVYANNAAAIAAGLTAGAFYRTGGDPDPVCVVH